MLKLLYKGTLAFNSIAWMLVVYLIKQQWTMFGLPIWGMGLILLLLPILLSVVSVQFAKGLGNASLRSCKEGTLADNEFLPVYLGYFFVSLSVPDNTTMGFLSGIIFIFTCLSQTQYFNPLYLLLGYHFYHVLTPEGTRIFIIAHGEVIRNWNEVSFEKLKKINNTTYLALRGENQQ